LVAPGLTGFAELAASKPDGYTFGLVNVGGLLVFPHIMKVPYIWDSFRFLGGVAENYFGVGVATNSPIDTVEDLVATAKRRRVTYSASAIRPRAMTAEEFFEVIKSQAPTVESILTAAGMKKS
jgi:tripartite-type tricarboxylate transporter receptor subunit TctC